MPTVRDFLGFVVNPPPGDPTQTAMSDLLPKSAVTLPLPPPAAGSVPVSDGLGGYTWQAGAPPPAGTALPASPVDGQEYYYVVDATNGVVWHLKYRAASASAHKWEFVGGTPLTGEVNTTQGIGTATGSPTTFADFPTIPQTTVPIPLAGDYAIAFGCHASLAASEFASVSPVWSVGYTSTQATDLAYMATGAATAETEFVRTLPSRSIGTGAVLKLQYGLQGGVPRNFTHPWLSARPIRVG